MNIYEKYYLDKSEDRTVDKLPLKVDKTFYQVKETKTKSGYDELYMNEKGKLKHIATEPHDTSILLLFLKKYRKNPELLPKNIKHEYPMDFMSSEEIYKAMQLMLKPMNSFEEFKERLSLATKELPLLLKRRGDQRYGERIVFINKKEECGSGINIYGELIPILKKYDETYWEDAILFDKEKKIFACYGKNERTNDTPDRSNWGLGIKFYEEQHLYEYLLNQEICAVE